VDNYSVQIAGDKMLDRQIAALRSEAAQKFFARRCLGRTLQTVLSSKRAIDELGTGDVLVVAEWDRVTRSMMDGVHLIERINKRGAPIKVLDKPHLDLTTPIGRGFIAFLSALAKDERQRIVKRANDGRRAARARGARPETAPER
jgi:DNA invertase Pin-like site-specific DNA recombinase